MDIDWLTSLYESAAEFLVGKGFDLLGALIVIIIGMIIARKVGRLAQSLSLKNKLDVTLSGFIGNTVRITIIVMVGVIALQQIGISITPLVAAIGALSLGAGLAVQGTLSNYGAGLNIIFARPFVVGDTIEVQGVTGIVKEVHLAYTILTDEDGVRILIPNRHIVGEIIHNSQSDRMVELSVGIAYHCDPKKAVTVVQEALENLPGISTERRPQVGIDEFADSSINIVVRCWIKTERLHETRFAANQAIHSALQQHGLEIPFPQRDVHLIPDAKP